MQKVEFGKKVLIFKDIEDISDFAIKKLTDIAKKAIDKKSRFTLAVSGGKTPIRLYQKLAGQHALPWDKIHIFMVDERFIPFNDLESNYGMIKRNLLDNINFPEENAHPIYIEETAEDSAEKYEKSVKKFFYLKKSELPEFDLVILGIGRDGHTASLFSGSKALGEKERLAIAVNYEKLNYKRITLTLSAINNAANIIFMVTDKDKAEIIKEILEEENTKLPASLVRPRHKNILFLLDKDSSSLLKGETR